MPASFLKLADNAFAHHYYNDSTESATENQQKKILAERKTLFTRCIYSALIAETKYFYDVDTGSATVKPDKAHWMLRGMAAVAGIVPGAGSIKEGFKFISLVRDTYNESTIKQLCEKLTQIHELFGLEAIYLRVARDMAHYFEPVLDILQDNQAIAQTAAQITLLMLQGLQATLKDSKKTTAKRWLQSLLKTAADEFINTYTDVVADTLFTATRLNISFGDLPEEIQNQIKDAIKNTALSTDEPLQQLLSDEADELLYQARYNQIIDSLLAAPWHYKPEKHWLRHAALITETVDKNHPLTLPGLLRRAVIRITFIDGHHEYYAPIHRKKGAEAGLYKVTSYHDSSGFKKLKYPLLSFNESVLHLIDTNRYEKVDVKGKSKQPYNASAKSKKDYFTLTELVSAIELAEQDQVKPLTRLIIGTTLDACARTPHQSLTTHIRAIPLLRNEHINKKTFNAIDWTYLDASACYFAQVTLAEKSIFNHVVAISVYWHGSQLADLEMQNGVYLKNRFIKGSLLNLNSLNTSYVGSRFEEITIGKINGLNISWTDATFEKVIYETQDIKDKLESLRQELNSEQQKLEEQFAQKIREIEEKIGNEYQSFLHQIADHEKRIQQLESDRPVINFSHLKAKALQVVKDVYLKNDSIKAVFGEPLKQENQFVNLQMICQAQKVKNPAANSEQADTATEQAQTSSSDTVKQAKNPAKLFKEVRVSSYEYLFGDKIALDPTKLFLPANQILTKDFKSTETDANKPPHFLLVQGRAGIGKTTFVTHVAWAWSKGNLWPEFEWVFTLRLRDLRDSRFKLGDVLSLSKWIYLMYFKSDSFFDDEKEYKNLWEREIEPKLKQQKGLIILDGYDEIPRDHPCKDALEKLLQSDVPLMITSRPHSVSGISSFNQHRRDLEIVGFIDENVEKYIKHYFTEMPQKADEIIVELRKNPAIWASAHIPLLLNIMCGELEHAKNIQDVIKELDTFTGLYKQLELTLLESAFKRTDEVRWAVEFKGLKFNRQNFLEDEYAKQRKVLAHIAFKALDKRQLILPIELVEEVLKEEGIAVKEMQKFINQLLDVGLIKAVNDAANPQERVGYEFLHFTFQEYYAGLYLAWAAEYKEENLQNKISLPNVLRKIKFNSQYQIALWFMAGNIKDKELFKQFIALLQDESTRDLLGNYQLGLLIRCTDENFKLAQEQGLLAPIIRQFEVRLNYIIKAGDDITIDKDTVWIRLFALSPNWQASSIVKAIFIRLIKQESWLKIIRIFKNSVFANVVVMPETLSKIANSLFHPENRWAAFDTIELLGLAAATPVILTALMELLSHPSDRVRWVALKIIKKLGPAAATPTVLIALETFLSYSEDKMWWTAFYVIKCLGPAAAIPAILTALINLLSHLDEDVRLEAKATLQCLGPAAATPTVLIALEMFLSHSDSKIRREDVLEIIQCIGPAAATPVILASLEELLFHPEDDLKRVVIKTIGSLREAAATPIILAELEELLCYPDEVVIEAIAGLGEAAGTSSILIKLEDLASHVEDGKMWQFAMIIIFKIGRKAVSPFILNICINLLSYPVDNVRFAAKQIIGRASPVVVTPANLAKLAELLSHPNDNVKEFTIRTINEELGLFEATPSFLTLLVNLLSHSVDAIKYAAKEILERLGPAAATPTILSKLEELSSHSDDIMKRIAIELISYLDPRAITSDFLIKLEELLSHSDASMQRAAIRIIGRLGQAAITPMVLARLSASLTRSNLFGFDTLFHHLIKKNTTTEVLAKIAVSSLEKMIKLLNRNFQSTIISLIRSLSPTLSSPDFHSYISKNNNTYCLVAAFVLAFYSPSTSIAIQWNDNEKKYFLTGYVDKEPFSIMLEPFQAQWVRRCSAELIGKLLDFDFSYTLGFGSLLDIKVSMFAPKPENDSLLHEYQAYRKMKQEQSNKQRLMLLPPPEVAEAPIKQDSASTNISPGIASSSITPSLR